MSEVESGIDNAQIDDLFDIEMEEVTYIEPESFSVPSFSSSPQPTDRDESLSSLTSLVSASSLPSVSEVNSSLTSLSSIKNNDDVDNIINVDEMSFVRSISSVSLDDIIYDGEFNKRHGWLNEPIYENSTVNGGDVCIEF